MAQEIVTRNRKLGIWVAVVTAAIYGIYTPASRAAYADGANAIFLIIASIFCRGAFMAAYCALKGLKLFSTKEEVKSALIGGFLQAVFVMGVMGGLVFLEGPLVMMILFTFPLLLFFYLLARGEERFSLITLFLTFTALGGLTFVLDVWNSAAQINWIGVMLSVLAAFMAVLRMHFFGKRMEKLSPFVAGAEILVSAFFFVLLLLFWDVPKLPATGIGYAWSAAAVASLVIASFGMFWGLALLGPFSWSLFSKLEPVFVAIFSALFLGEILKASQYFGMLIVLLSLVAYQYTTRRDADRT